MDRKRDCTIRQLDAVASMSTTTAMQYESAPVDGTPIIIVMVFVAAFALTYALGHVHGRWAAKRSIAKQAAQPVD